MHGIDIYDADNKVKKNKTKRHEKILIKNMKSLVKMRLESVFWTLTSQKGHRQKQQRQYSLGQSGDSGQNSLCQPSKHKLNTYKRKAKSFYFYM